MLEMFRTSTWHAARLVMVAAWLIAVVTTGDVVADSVANLSSAGRWTLAIGAWTLWALTLVAVAVRHTVALTILRLGTTTAVVAALIAVAVADPSTGSALAAVAPVASAAIAALSRPIGEAWIDGASYGDEHRFPLRVPVILLWGPIPLAWAGVVAGVLVGPILVANQRWVTGVIACIVGAATVFAGSRALHGLGKRWLVMVPAGVVVHDLMTTREPFLMVHGQVADVGPARADLDLTDPDVLDATQGAPGLVLSISLEKPVELVLRPPRGGVAEATRRRTIAVVPSRPVAVVEEFNRRRALRTSRR